MSAEGPRKPGRPGTALTDAVVAALAKVDEKAGGAEAEGAEARPAGPAAPPAKVPPKVEAAGPNGFRSGPGSFSDLMRRWAGGAPLPRAAAEPAPPPPKVEPAKGEPAKVESPKVEPAKGEPAKGESPKAVEGPGAEEPTLADASLEEAARAEARPPGPREAETEPPPEAAPAEAAAGPTEPATAGGPVEVRYYGQTDVGLVREHNEDNFLVAEISGTERNPDGPRESTVDERGCVFAVCDGMGGAAAGEIASQMAVDTIFEVMSATPPASNRDEFARRIVTAIEEAGHRIFSAAKMDRSRRGMGTTTTLAGLVDGLLFVGQVGDSRAYVLREGELVQITKDQSLVNQLIEAGQLTEEEAEAFEHSNIILQALGTTEDVTVDLTFLELRRGDRLMMCSDGLSGLVHGDMIREVLAEEKELTDAAAKLIQMANAGGGHDNITVILADFDGEGLAEPAGVKVSYQQYPLPPAEDAPAAELPPAREPHMKPGATKPGADVKAAAPGMAPLAPAQGSGGMKLGIAAGLIALVVAGAAASFYFLGRGGGEGGAADDGAPPPPPATQGPEEPVAPPEAPVAPPEAPEAPPEAPVAPLEEPVVPPEEPPVEEAPEPTGTVRVATDVTDGHLFVNGEDRGAIRDGMTVELAPGGYRIEARADGSSIASRTVTVTAGETTSVELDMPVAPPEEPPPPESRPTRPSGRHGDRPRGTRHGSRRETPAHRTHAGPLPDNPF